MTQHAVTLMKSSIKDDVRSIVQLLVSMLLLMSLGTKFMTLVILILVHFITILMKVKSNCPNILLITVYAYFVVGNWHIDLKSKKHSSLVTNEFSILLTYSRPTQVMNYVCVVGCRYNAVQYDIILHTAVQRLKQNIAQSINSQKTHHT